MAITVDGVEYVTTTEAIERFGSDITADTIRGWVRMGKLRPAGRVNGGEWVFRSGDLEQAELDTRKSPFGRPRRTVDTSANMTITGLLALTNRARKPWACDNKQAQEDSNGQQARGEAKVA